MSSEVIPTQAGGAPQGADPGQAVGSPPDPSATSNQNDAETRAQELRRKVTEQAETLKDYEALFEVQKAHPDKPFSAVVQYARSGQWEPTGPNYDELLSSFEDGPTKDAMLALAKAAADDAYERARNEFAPVARSVAEISKTRQFESGLRERGLDVHDQAFREFQQKAEQDDPVYRTLLAANRQHAAAYLAERFPGGGGQSGNSQAHAARGATVHAGGRRGAASAQSEGDFVTTKTRAPTIQEISAILRSGKKVRLPDRASAR